MTNENALINFQINPKRVDKIKADIIEIGFGNGEYTVYLSKKFKDKKILGIEISGESANKLSKKIKKENIKNVLYIKLPAIIAFELFLEDNSVEAIFINFPDPWPKKRHQERRITTAEHLFLFAKKLKKEGFIQLKTDHSDFLDFSIQEAEKLKCFEIFLIENPKESTQTKYEKKWLEQGKKIFTVRFIKKSEPNELTSTSIPKIKKVNYMPKLKINEFLDFSELEGKTFKIEPNLVAKFFRAFQRKNEEWLIETLLVEDNYTHYFFTYLKKLPNDSFVLSVSNFSEVIKTEGVVKFIKWLSNIKEKNKEENKNYL
jgi:tRNA (guanine-N7-)-methyltransferase